MTGRREEGEVEGRREREKGGGLSEEGEVRREEGGGGREGRR